MSLLDFQGWRLEYAEKLGLLGTFGDVFYPQLTTIIDADWITLCNYGDSTLPYYWLYPNNCTTVGVKDIYGNTAIAIRPNPSISAFSIYLSDLGPGLKNVHIYDTIGQSIYQSSVGLAELTLHLYVPAGIYYLAVSSRPRSTREKIVIDY